MDQERCVTQTVSIFYNNWVFLAVYGERFVTYTTERLRLVYDCSIAKKTKNYLYVKLVVSY